jgi:hypothetical protein
MELCVECTMAGPFGRGKRFVKDCGGPVRIASSMFGSGKLDLHQPVEVQEVPFAQQFGTTTHILEPIDGRAGVRRRTTLQKYSMLAPRIQIVLPHEPG